MIIVVTGTPGVGKTVLGRLLARKLGGDFLDVGEFVRREKLYSKYDRSYRTFVVDERRVRKKVRDFAATHTGRVVVVETHSVGSMVPKLHGMVAIVVRLDPLVLTRRLKSRKWSKRKVWDNVEAEMIDLSLYEAVKLLGRSSVIEVDATGKRSPELLNEALRRLSKTKRKHSRSPDWLDKYDPIELSRRILQ